MSEFLAGAAERDITPEPGVPLWGYSDRTCAAEGVLDPLYARSIVFRAAGGTVAMTALDLGRVPMRNACERICSRAAAAGVDHVFLAATHTHHAPVMEDEDAPYAVAIENAIGACIEAAVARLRPARIGLGRTEVDIAHNRRRIRQDGRCEMLWRNEARLPTAPVDREAAVIKIEREDGAPLGTLVHFACHPVVMGPSNCLISADYVGELTRIVREETGAPCLFFQGACGDLNPYLDKTPVDEGAVEAMRAVGREAARAVLVAWRETTVRAPEAPSVAFSEQPVHVGTRWEADDAARALFREIHGDMFERYIDKLHPDLEVPLGVVVLNGNLGFVGIPGEVFVHYQLELKTISPLPDTFLCGYANDYHAYFPTVRDAAAGGYGGTVASYVGLGAADKLISEGAIAVGRLAGRLRPCCTPENFVILDALEADTRVPSTRSQPNSPL